MDEETKRVLANIAHWGNAHPLATEVKGVLAGAALEIQRLAADNKRLRRRDPTLQDAVELLNKHKYHGFEWTSSDDGHSVSGTGRNNYGNPEWATWSAKEAIKAAKMIEAVAEKRVREKESQ